MTKGILNSAETVGEANELHDEGSAAGHSAKHLRRPDAFSGNSVERDVAGLTQDEVALIQMYRQMPEDAQRQFISRCLEVADLPSPIATRLRALLH